MTVWDDRILEYIEESEQDAASVGELTDSDVIHVTNTHVSRRCNKLAEKGMLVALGNGVFSITDKGRAYLEGDYDAENEAYMDAGQDADEGPTAGETPGEL
jgi:hypothetical protein